jgi:hypothetical protein
MTALCWTAGPPPPWAVAVLRRLTSKNKATARAGDKKQ